MLIKDRPDYLRPPPIDWLINRIKIGISDCFKVGVTASAGISKSIETIDRSPTNRVGWFGELEGQPASNCGLVGPFSEYSSNRARVF